MAAARSATSPHSSRSAIVATSRPMSSTICPRSPRESWSVSSNHPTTLLAEITHRCPLHCPYCSNPLEMIRADGELTTGDWKRVFSQARELGVLQLGLSGGEPLVRPDVEELAAHAHTLGLYTTLVTSGVGLTPHRAERLREAGLEHIQISIQDTDHVVAD